MKNRNKTVAYLRIIALICILMHHSFTMYFGWPPLDFKIGEPKTFGFEGMLSGSLKFLGLGLFTFLSGFCLYYSKEKNITFVKFVINKLRRLFVPCLIFALLYKLVFPSMMFDQNPVNGTHLWFIPMIFMCIMVVSSQLYIERGWIVVIIVYAIIRKITYFVEFRTLYEFITYFPVFYCGFLINMILTDGDKKIKQIKERDAKIIDYLFIVGIFVTIPYFTKVTKRLFLFNSEYIALAIMLSVIYVITNRIILSRKRVLKVNRINKFLNNVDNNSFSIYLVHQFYINMILVILKDKITLIPVVVGSCLTFVFVFFLFILYNTNN